MSTLPNRAPMSYSACQIGPGILNPDPLTDVDSSTHRLPHCPRTCSLLGRGGHLFGTGGLRVFSFLRRVPNLELRIPCVLVYLSQCVLLCMSPLQSWTRGSGCWGSRFGGGLPNPGPPHLSCRHPKRLFRQNAGMPSFWSWTPASALAAWLPFSCT
jgi:hypothetical protein